ncbi:MAG: UDP-N-acetylmuramate dehydrogenase [Gammaproteobacteria bacterium]|nr:UDP-N-acetylmuramate dehydrogenase [Gammaproteobacteria bacterium]TVQ47072.1 MAG: UDP-N-acetylmuramate dehydrogenase [Gammaproteobacteria bacterium]
MSPAIDFRPQGELRFEEPMARHTSWRVGGPAEYFFRPASIEDLAAMLAATPPEVAVFWCGLGSNLLVRDGGLRGLVVNTTGLLSEVRRLDARRLQVGAGVPCTVLARHCVRHHLGPAEFFAGIPGTVGGALAMNAGAYGGETWSFVESVTTIDRQGQVHERAPGDFTVGYRSVIRPGGEWFLAAVFRFRQDPETSRERVQALMARRKQTQPLGLPSCGSVFRNPPDDHAARLIEAAGLKGHLIGGAQVSPKHANFIINTGTATAADIEALIDHVQRRVAEVHGVELTHEVRIVGETT